jgi:hypothetical protein
MYLATDDFKFYCIPLSKEFRMTISPYNDIAKIESEKLDWFRDYTLVKSGDNLDSLTKILWRDGLSDDIYKNFFDLVKVKIPVSFIKLDTVWKSPFTIFLDGVWYSDSAKVLINGMKDGVFNLGVNLDSLIPWKGNYRFYGIEKNLLSIDSSKATGSYSISITPRGIIREASGLFNSEVFSSSHREKFRQTISTYIEYKLLNQTKY